MIRDGCACRWRNDGHQPQFGNDVNLLPADSVIFSLFKMRDARSSEGTVPANAGSGRFAPPL
jgi:hypothetical protein